MILRSVLRQRLGGCIVLLTLYGAPLAAQEPNWVLKSPVSSPPPRSAHSLAYDAARGQVVLSGGSHGGFAGTTSDTWVWDGTNWTQKSPANSPGPIRLHAMTYDTDRGQVVLFGGFHPVISEDPTVS